MASKITVERRLMFRKSALERLYDAYEALLKGGVKSYVIDDRQLTRLDLPALADEIREMEREVDELTALAEGQRPRKAWGVIPRDW
ncbi:hypothetical protein [uncultured Dysosmobacter sp.]|uniref:hypothetical protein n=1 Tax=uncultured Dysosmobacter sp. TaxID=2591384 RepID=UPI00261FB299|nr:hypothetical protein [uncultured Dysosmobacter sp.]